MSAAAIGPSAGLVGAPDGSTRGCADAAFPSRLAAQALFHGGEHLRGKDLGVGAHRDVGRSEAEVLHRGAVVDVRLERAIDHRGRDLAADRGEQPGRIDPVEEQHDVRRARGGDRSGLMRSVRPARCSSCRVGKAAADLRSVATRAPTSSARRTRASQLACERDDLPAKMTGRFAPTSRSATCATIFADATAGAAGAKRSTFGSGTGAASGASCSPTSRHTYTGPRGASRIMASARSIVSTSASGERGSSSHLTLPRSSAPWSFVVWIQSIHGRRSLASTGPLAPITSIGARSHHAL